MNAPTLDNAIADRYLPGAAETFVRLGHADALPDTLAGALGQTVALMPCKGGAGATFVAANLAHALAADGKRVCLIDLNLQFGDAALFVSAAKSRETLADVASETHRLDRTLLEASMMRVAPGFWLLPAPPSPELAQEIRADDIGRILAVARRHYDFVILDVPRTLDANTIRALDAADRIYLVLQPTSAYLRGSERLLQLLNRLGYGRARVHLLVNRLRRGSEIALPEIESVLGQPVTATLPNAYAPVSRAIRRRVSIFDLAPRDPLATALRTLARELSTRPAAPANPAGWVGRHMPALSRLTWLRLGSRQPTQPSA